MAGYRPDREGWRPHIEAALSISTVKMKRDGMLESHTQHSGSWSWKWSGTGEPSGSVRFYLALNSTDGLLTLSYLWREQFTECRIEMVTTPMHFGGVRWWMVCPYTGKRAAKLYAFNGIRYFCHREAISPLPTYDSQRSTKMDRIIDQRWKIRQRLGCAEFCTLLDPLVKPKRMRWSTFAKWEERDNALAEQEFGMFARLLGFDEFGQLI